MIKTRQYRHQSDVYNAHKDDRFYALFWEMGLGKTKTLLDVAAHLHENGRIEALMVIAPNAVYTNWATQEAPKHLGVDYVAMTYHKATNRRDEARQLIFLDPSFEPTKLRVLCMSYDSVGTEHGYDYAKELLETFSTMIVADESTAIKTHSAKRTKRTKNLGKLASYRWIASGTPVAESPFDIHSQIAFMAPNFWKTFGLNTFGAFKNEFGEFVLRRVSGGRQFNELKNYRRIDRLHSIVSSVSSRLLKEDSTVELPPKSYAIRSFKMLPAQKELYHELKTSFMAELDGGFVEAPLAITRLMRMQQITSGFVTVEAWPTSTSERPCDSDYGQAWDLLQSGQQAPKVEPKIENLMPPWQNPRLELLSTLIDECSHKVIVWCRFRHDVDLIVHKLGDACVKYDGSVGRVERQSALERFNSPTSGVKVLVANVHAISQGVTLTIAKTMIYYSNSFSLEKRLQSEDRNHRIGQDSPVLIIDLVAEQSVDGYIIKAMRDKFDVAASVTGDKLREWI